MTKAVVARVLFFVLIVFLVYANATTLNPNNRPEATTFIPQVVRVHTLHGRCSGFIAAKDRVVTAAHCFEGDEPLIIVELITGQGVPAEIHKIGFMGITGEDWAVLKVDTGTLPPVKIARKLPPIGTTLRSVGYPHGHDRQVSSQGKFVSMRDRDLHLEMTVYQGESGGLLLNPDTSEAVGIIFGTYGILGTSDHTPITSVLEALYSKEEEQ